MANFVKVVGKVSISCQPTFKGIYYQACHLYEARRSVWVVWCMAVLTLFIGESRSKCWEGDGYQHFPFLFHRNKNLRCSLDGILPLIDDVSNTSSHKQSMLLDVFLFSLHLLSVCFNLKHSSEFNSYSVDHIKLEWRKRRNSISPLTVF